MTVGERIKMLREQNGMTQDDLAKIIKSTKQTIYKYENNIVTNIPSDKLEIIAYSLNSTPAFLMGWEVATKKSLVHDLDQSELRLLSYYNMLNDTGKKKAVDNIFDLTQIPAYCNNYNTYAIDNKPLMVAEEPIPYNCSLNAAHSIEESSEEEKAFDEELIKKYLNNKQ